MGAVAVPCSGCSGCGSVHYDTAPKAHKVWSGWSVKRRKDDANDILRAGETGMIQRVGGAEGHEEIPRESWLRGRSDSDSDL